VHVASQAGSNKLTLISPTPEHQTMWFNALKAGLTGMLIVSDDELSDYSGSDDGDEEDLVDLASLPDPSPLTRSGQISLAGDDDLNLSEDDEFDEVDD
jgi:hypothetical protein